MSSRYPSHRTVRRFKILGNPTLDDLSSPLENLPHGADAFFEAHFAEGIGKASFVLTMSIYALIVIFVGLLLSLPIINFGFPPVGDVPFHYQWQANFTRQLLAGDLYPRWLFNQ